MVLGEETRIMAILNVTPDSFSDGNRFLRVEDAVRHGLTLIKEGADILDIGGESTRPGSRPVSADEELSRILPVIQTLAGETDVPISVDTVKASVAQQAIQAGASIINDISGLLWDTQLAEVASTTGAALILGHIRGTPADMHEIEASTDILREVKEGWQQSIEKARQKGVSADRLLLDPGIGFGKNTRENLLLLRRLDEVRPPGFPVMVGVSRKRFLGQLLNQAEPSERLLGSLAAGITAVLHGACLLRVHDVMPTRQAVKIADAIRQSDPMSDHERR